MTRPIYLDNNATTPIDPVVLEAMMPYLTGEFGNAASSSHVYGWQAAEAVETGRNQVARLIGGAPREIVFTSGATESNNLALKGAARAYREKGRHLVSCATEHKAVLDTLKSLEAEGFEVTILPVNPDGLLDLDRLAAAIRPDTTVVSIMAANNEIGVLQPLEAIGSLCRSREVVFHTDAVQAAGKIPVDVDRWQADLVSLTAHKLYGPKGVGALYVRQRDRKIRIAPQIDGGGHERGMRSGTLNVPGIVGLGKAFAVAKDSMAEESCRIEGWRNRLWETIRTGITDVVLNGSLEHRLPGNLNVSIPNVEGESLVAALRDVAISSSSACSSASMEPSHVLKALGLSTPLAFRALRFGIGRFNTEAEITLVGELLVRKVTELRASSPLYSPS
ncbi:MAG TPA: IscS subfamily cysteine desulfurase [Candidatus Eisenbacteria bacterium]